MKNIINLENKTILVTGASSGIGRSTCKVISEYGAKVIMVARRDAETGDPFHNSGGGAQILSI